MLCGDVSPNVASIVETVDGDIVTESVGARPDCCPREESVGDGCVVLYQRGLLPNTKEVNRTHRSLLSPFTITHEGVTAYVPWKSFAHITRDRGEGFALDDYAGANNDTFNACWRDMSDRNVAAVWLHGENGDHVYHWFTVFKSNPMRLVGVPRRYCSALLKELTVDIGCSCGGCVHPLRRAAPTFGMGTKTFSKLAASRFEVYRSRVTKVIHPERECAAVEKTGCASAPSSAEAVRMKEGTCAICLEDAFVCEQSCIQKRCSLEVCATCRAKMRGLCPICDRAKLSRSVEFLCSVCNSTAPLKDYGFDCIHCKSHTLCVSCYRSFGQCTRCELDIAAPKCKRQKK